MSHELSVRVVAKDHADAIRQINNQARHYFGTDNFQITNTEARMEVGPTGGKVQAWAVEADVNLHAFAEDAGAWVDKEVGR